MKQELRELPQGACRGSAVSIESSARPRLFFPSFPGLGYRGAFSVFLSIYRQEGPAPHGA